MLVGQGGAGKTYFRQKPLRKPNRSEDKIPILKSNCSYKSIGMYVFNSYKYYHNTQAQTFTSTPNKHYKVYSNKFK